LKILPQISGLVTWE